jgi:tetratricopeptide (TPR) repeat protein
LSEVVASAEDIQLGVRASQEGRYDDAILRLTRVIESGIKTDVVLYHLARSLFKVKRYRESVRYWEDLFAHYSGSGNTELRIRIRMNLASAKYMAAQAEAEQGRFRQSIELLKKYLEHYPGDRKAKLIISQLEELAGDAEKIRKHLKAAIEHIEAERWSDASNEFLALM